MKQCALAHAQLHSLLVWHVTIEFHEVLKLREHLSLEVSQTLLIFAHLHFLF